MVASSFQIIPEEEFSALSPIVDLTVENQAKHESAPLTLKLPHPIARLKSFTGDVSDDSSASGTITSPGGDVGTPPGFTNGALGKKSTNRLFVPKKVRPKHVAKRGVVDEKVATAKAPSVDVKRKWTG